MKDNVFFEMKELEKMDVRNSEIKIQTLMDAVYCRMNQIIETRDESTWPKVLSDFLLFLGNAILLLGMAEKRAIRGAHNIGNERWKGIFKITAASLKTLKKFYDIVSRSEAVRYGQFKYESCSNV